MNYILQNLLHKDKRVKYTPEVTENHDAFGKASDNVIDASNVVLQ